MTSRLTLLVSPASLFDRFDPFTTGVTYMPIGLAYGASSLVKTRHNIEVLDMFGESPKNAEKLGDFVRLGCADVDLINRIKRCDPQLVVFYANQVVNHDAIVESIRETRMNFPHLLIGLIENTQAVTAYSLHSVSDEIFTTGADFYISGEMEFVLSKVIDEVCKGAKISEIDLVGFNTKDRRKTTTDIIENLDELSIPAWEYFPLKNYWDLGFSHGPLSSNSYFPILTSRGCPFPCKFCVVPSTNNRKWRARSSQSVVDEISYLNKKYGVSEFHLEDLNPTISDIRMQEIAREITSRKLEIDWKIVAGTKVESIKSLETLRLMKHSGLSYLSISPESGSKQVLRDIGKPFNVKHARSIIRECYKIGITTQACFVLGYTTEKFLDRIKTLKLCIQLTVSGIDEIVLFIMAPMPGSGVFESYIGQYKTLSSLNFSPRWRKDYIRLLAWRITAYIVFFITKFIKNPARMLRQVINMLKGNYKTKMEMVPVRGVKYLKIAKNIKKNS